MHSNGQYRLYFVKIFERNGPGGDCSVLYHSNIGRRRVKKGVTVGVFKGQILQLSPKRELGSSKTYNTTYLYRI